MNFKIKRRLKLAAMAFALLGATSTQLFAQNFEPTLESFEQYQYPEWFRDAKFGIWSHWGPQAVPRQGDWYARNMYYQEGGDWETRYYQHHVKTYGHPTVFGYKDIIPMWKAERWEPDSLMALFKKVGAKYFVSMATHHDNFYLWNSKLHKWNSVNMGPKKDVVKLWQDAARKEGLYFGVSEHLAASYTWFQASRGADKTGSFAGVPYDGANPAYEDLYHAATAPDDTEWLTKDPANHQKWLERITELVDMYQPDLLYSDSELPFGEVGRTLLAHYYNQDQVKNNGKLQAVYTCKLLQPKGRWVQDVERGALDSISPYPWQTDTSIGDWYYRTGQSYMTGTQVVQMLVDIVSKNGNLLLNVVQTPEGDLEPDVLQILEEIAQWTSTNGTGIYGTRPWKIYGEGPSTDKNQEKGRFGGVKDVRPYTAGDFRFTIKGSTLFAFCMEKPVGDVRIKSLGKQSAVSKQKVVSVQMLGSSQKLNWKQEADAFVIQNPSVWPSWNVPVFQIEFAK